jgi:hypothetical protein
VSETVARITEALAGADEGELTAILSSLGVGGALGVREAGERKAVVLRTPLPAPRECARIQSEIEWV